jgi:hypothetical protein
MKNMKNRSVTIIFSIALLATPTLLASSRESSLRSDRETSSPEIGSTKGKSVQFKLSKLVRAKSDPALDTTINLLPPPLPAPENYVPYDLTGENLSSYPYNTILALKRYYNSMIEQYNINSPRVRESIASTKATISALEAAVQHKMLPKSLPPS